LVISREKNIFSGKSGVEVSKVNEKMMKLHLHKRRRIKEKKSWSPQ